MGRRKRRDDKIIHVVFGPGGGRVERNKEPSRRAREDGATPGREPLTDFFTRSEISRLLEITPARLRTLDRAGVVSPTGRRLGRRAYTFSDLIALRTAQSLLQRKVRLRDVTRAIGLLKRTLPKVTRPLQALRIVSDGQRVVVRSHDGAFEPLTGQMLLDFEVRSLRDDVVRVLRPSAGRERARTAYALYLRASQLDEDPPTMDEAARLASATLAVGLLVLGLKAAAYLLTGSAALYSDAAESVVNVAAAAAVARASAATIRRPARSNGSQRNPRPCARRTTAATTAAPSTAVAAGPASRRMGRGLTGKPSGRARNAGRRAVAASRRPRRWASPASRPPP